LTHVRLVCRRVLDRDLCHALCRDHAAPSTVPIVPIVSLIDPSEQCRAHLRRLLALLAVRRLAQHVVCLLHWPRLRRCAPLCPMLSVLLVMHDSQQRQLQHDPQPNLLPTLSLIFAIEQSMFLSWPHPTTATTTILQSVAVEPTASLESAVASWSTATLCVQSRPPACVVRCLRWSTRQSFRAPSRQCCPLPPRCRATSWRRLLLTCSTRVWFWRWVQQEILKVFHRLALSMWRNKLE